MITPAARDVHVAARITFADQVETRDQRKRAPVRRLHIDFDAMQRERTECDVERQRERFGHQAGARVRRECVVTEIRAVECVSNDLGKIEYAAKRAVLVAKNQKADVRRRVAAIAFDERSEFASRRRRFGPVSVEPPACARGAQKRSFVARPRSTQMNAEAGGEERRIPRRHNDRDSTKRGVRLAMIEAH